MAAILAVGSLGIGGACTRGADAPEALTTYLDALVASNHRGAYDRTGLGELAQTSGEAATLSFGFFDAFLKADPLLSYSIRQVTTLDRRSIGSAQETGTPYFVVDVTLQHRSGAIDQTLSVEGAVRGVVEIDPVPVRISDQRGIARLTIDGVAVPHTSPLGAPKERTVLLLPGAHRIGSGVTLIELHTSPLKVTSGAGRIDDGVVVVG